MNPILDQPQTIEHAQLHPALAYQLANQELTFQVNAQTDLTELFWPWADAVYARYIRLRVVALRDDPLTPLVTRFYPGYQEEILGNEGMIVSKRLAAPRNSPYDRSVLWTLECQAEGDRLLRLEIDIDWGEPLTQRLVDGLLVAQRNPGPAQGIYDQSNAESTRVFGNPFGRPDVAELDDPQRARLVYHVLVNGTVEVPLLLTVSDVGEQVAWNGFLGLRDTERAFELSVKAWNDLLKAGRVWTPDAALNQAIQASKIEAARRVQRLRSGVAPTDRDVRHLPALIGTLDLFDVTGSRNLLAHVRRVAERSNGRLPRQLPILSSDALPDPGAAVAQTNRAYLLALYEHLRHHFSAELLAEHYRAVQACAEALIHYRWQVPIGDDAATLVALGATLRRALGLALHQLDSVNTVRWESEACELERQAEALTGVNPHDLAAPVPLAGWRATSEWQPSIDQPWHFDDPWEAVGLAGEAVWQGCGVRWERQQTVVEPAWPAAWPWWALLDLPLGEKRLSLLWDGETLHATQPVQSALPLQLHERISALRADEYDFDLHFELKSTVDGQTQRTVFKPQFLT
jgi:hypothetical protein